jgi:hypothetical protein
MEDVVVFTRQRGESCEGTEQETLEVQLRVIEAYAQRKELRIVDRIALTGISAHGLFHRMLEYLDQDPIVESIITYSSDRLFGGFRDMQLFDDLVGKRGITLYIAVDDKIVMTGQRMVTRRIVKCSLCGHSISIERLSSSRTTLSDASRWSFVCCSCRGPKRIDVYKEGRSRHEK